VTRYARAQLLTLRSLATRARDTLFLLLKRLSKKSLPSLRNVEINVGVNVKNAGINVKNAGVDVGNFLGNAVSR